MGDSRIFWLNSDSDSGAETENQNTILESSLEVLKAPPKLSMRELFTKHYDRISEWLASDEREGVALMAMDAEAVRGAAFLVAKPDNVSTAVIGRHSQADLRLSGDASLSLRHLILLLYPRPESSESPSRIRYRILDLRTATGFLDERGKRLRALEADGPAFIRCGRYTILVFPVTDANDPWPDDPERAWQRIPDRLYLDEVETKERSPDWEKDSDRAWEVESLPQLSEPPTLVHHVAGPQMAVHELLAEGESGPIGELHVASSRGTSKVVVGHDAAQSGILLGRSRRCDAGRVLSDRLISRVHLLVIELGGRVYGIDTASYNGVFEGEQRERCNLLEPGRPLSLSEVATIEWRPRE